MDKLRICFAGTPAFAAAHLQALLDAGHEVVGVYTQPDRPFGRGKKLKPSPVKQVALENELPVFQPSTLKSDEETDALVRLRADLLIVVAYGLILPKPFLDTPKHGCLNVHASLLPQWRGAAPIERSLLAGDKVTGVTIMQMDEGLDTGAMLDTQSVSIMDSDNRVDVEQKLQLAGQQALLRVLADLESMQKNAQKQNDALSTYAAKLEKSEAQIDWANSATYIDRLVRAGIGRTPAYTMMGENRLRIIEASVSAETFHAEAGDVVASNTDSFTVCCGIGALTVRRVQLPGKNAASVKDIRNARPELFSIGDSFDFGQVT